MIRRDRLERELDELRDTIREARAALRHASARIDRLISWESGTPFPAAAGNWGQVSEPFAIAAGPDVPDSNRSGSTEVISELGGATMVIKTLPVCKRCGQVGHEASPPDRPAGENCRAAAAAPPPDRSGSTSSGITARSFCQCDPDQQVAQFTRDGVWICAHCDQPRRPRGVTP